MRHTHDCLKNLVCRVLLYEPVCNMLAQASLPGWCTSTHPPTSAPNPVTINPAEPAPSGRSANI
jgi:hypothetical protein